MTVLVDDEITTGDPRLHAASVKNMIAETIRHIRRDVGYLDDPCARSLFDTTAEVLQGLWNACDRYQRENEVIGPDEVIGGE